MLKRDREAQLVETIRSWSFEKPFAVHYMFYDILDRFPAVCLDAEYIESFKQYLII